MGNPGGGGGPPGGGGFFTPACAKKGIKTEKIIKNLFISLNYNRQRYKFNWFKRKKRKEMLKKSGPSWARTSDPLIMSQVL